MEAWIAAAERGLVTHGSAAERLRAALATLSALQLDAAQTYRGLPYPFYKVVNPQGQDLPLPVRDADTRVPSGDDALLYASLIVVRGWAEARGFTDVAQSAATAANRMDFRPFLRASGGSLFLAHTLDSTTGALSSSNWDVFADEGGMVAWVAYVSGSITMDEFKRVTLSQHRGSAQWVAQSGTTFFVQEAAWFNAMFPWAVRSLGGFPIQDVECSAGTSTNFARDSLVPAAGAHLALGDQLRVDHPAFSDAMSQARGGRGLVGWIQGWYMPPNLATAQMPSAPSDVTPHALFVPLNALTELPKAQRERWVAEIAELIGDAAGYYHSSGDYPFGFEVIASPRANDTAYAGADDGRPVFETLSEAYTVLSLFNALQLNEGRPTLTWFAGCVPGYNDRLREVLTFLYPSLSGTAAAFRVDSSGNVFADGRVSASAFHLAAADVAEWVTVSRPVEPGDVLELDPSSRRRYRKSEGACSHLIVGVVSTQPGIALGASGVGPQEALLALTGIVPVKVTDEGGPILLGDLLVSSSTPGAAMRWAGSRSCPCAIVGKALDVLPLGQESGILHVLLTAH
jgi:hypothetical protein